MSDTLLVVVAAIVVIALATALAPRVNVAGPLVLMTLGAGVSLLPFVPDIYVEPEWILVGVLPPLLYSAAVQLPAVEFRRDFGPIAGLSVVLVVIIRLGDPGPGPAPRDRPRRDPQSDGCRRHLDREETRDRAPCDHSPRG